MTDLQNLVLDLVFDCIRGAVEAHGETVEYDVAAFWKDNILWVKITRK